VPPHAATPDSLHRDLSGENPRPLRTSPLRPSRASRRRVFEPHRSCDLSSWATASPVGCRAPSPTPPRHHLTGTCRPPQSPSPSTRPPSSDDHFERLSCSVLTSESSYRCLFRRHLVFCRYSVCLSQRNSDGLKKSRATHPKSSRAEHTTPRYTSHECGGGDLNYIRRGSESRLILGTIRLGETCRTGTRDL
jgi:hypothetical protein